MSDSILEQNEAQLKLASHIALARHEYLAYRTFIDPYYETPDHVRLLAGYFNAVNKGDIKRLAVIMPPRHGKSDTGTGSFPAYFSGSDTTRTSILTACNAMLAEKFSMQNRDTIGDNPRWPLVFPGVTLSAHNRGRERWSLEGRQETMLAAGVGGTIVGFGANLLMADDLVKNYEEAISSTLMESRYMWYTMAAHTRLTPNGIIILIGTLWSENDVMSRILASEEGKDFVVLHLPAISYGSEKDYITAYPVEEDRAKKLAELPKTAFPDRLHRPKDTPLWPERFPLDFLLNKRMVLGHEFEAAYQGNPSAPEGNKFKRAWFRPITQQVLDAVGAKRHSQYRAYDLAWSARTSADFTVGTKASVYTLPRKGQVDNETVKEYLEAVKLPPVFMVIEVVDRWQQEWDESADKIVDLAQADGEACKLLVEAVASQNKGFKSLRRNIKMWKHTIIPILTNKDKEINAKYSQQLGGAGLFFILYPNSTTPPEWEADFLNELGKFPNGKNDDQVDTISILSNHTQPIIDKLLQSKETLGVWRTPFMPKNSPSQREPLSIPFELQRVVPGGPRQQMGWQRQ